MEPVGKDHFLKNRITNMNHQAQVNAMKNTVTNTSITLTVMCCLAGLLPFTSNAALLAYEGFDYTAGSRALKKVDPHFFRK